MKILDAIRSRLLFFDGAMGTQLQEAGIRPGELPELWNLQHPEAVRAIHARYLAAGCDIVTTNTFGANRLKLGDRLAPAIEAGVLLARGAADAAAGDRPRFVALDLGPCGRLLEPLGTTSFEEAYELFAEAVRIGTATGQCDCVLVETMGDLYEAKAAVLAAKETCDLPVFCTMTFDEKGKTLTGGSAAAAVAVLEGLGVDCLGLNCGLGPAQAAPVFEELRTYATVPILLQPNAGMPTVREGRTVYGVQPEEFSLRMAEFARAGARVLGGCCGTTPAHIAALVRACKDLPPVVLPPKEDTLVASYSRCVSIGGAPVLIGERINPTGKKALKEALRSGDLGLVLREAALQDDHGADILDVNVGLPGIDERAMLVRAVRAVQSVTDRPLQLDSADAGALAAAMRIYNGKPMINSVNGKQTVMRAVFPQVKKYGGVVVGLCLDESGIPETPEGRLAIARRIVETAAEYGIARKDIVIDALTLTISADQREAFRTLDALSRIKRELGVKTVLGVSNVSFGLPRRELVNSAFLTLALRAGLDAPILDPCSEEMQRACRTFCVLSGADAQCAAYIEAYAGTGANESRLQAQAAGTLYEIVVKGMRELAADAARQELQTKAPLEIIETVLIPALDAVGQGYESGKLFLPQLIMSAETVQNAFAVLREQMKGSGTSAEPQGRILLATVKGDIHDIGKNIVKVLLENYGFEVLDLGRDVAPEAIVETARREGIRLVGLSALMTTTVASMQETIEALRAAGLEECCVVVGGAVLTQDYAERIGADFYARDAMETVRIAKRLF